MKLIPAVVVATQVLLSNFCFMPMAYGENAMPMDHDMQEMEQVTEMVMTPVNAMSPLHCDGCVTVIRPKHHTSDMEGGRMPCNDGHCLSEHSPSIAIATQSSQKDVLNMPARPMHLFLELPETSDVKLRPPADPTPQVFITRTIVLRE